MHVIVKEARTKGMAEAWWVVEFHDDFESEFEDMEDDVQDTLLAAAKAV